MNEKFTLSSTQQRKFLIGAVIGAALLILGMVLSGIEIGGSGHGHESPASEHATAMADASGSHGAILQDHHDATAAQEEGGHHAEKPGFWKRFGTVFLTGNWYFFGLSLFGVFFIAVSYAANAGWYIMVKRIWETYYRYLPVALGLILVGFAVFGSPWFHDFSIYEWMHLKVGEDELIDHKRPFLNPMVYLILVGGAGAFYVLIAHIFRTASLAEDNEGGLRNHKKSTKFAALFLPVFALSFSFMTFIVIMSLEPHWYSTIFAVYCFSGMFVLGMTVTALIAINLKEQGYLPQLNSEHLHDIGKYMFAFSVFWAYIWLSQFLLIWYANIPEEGKYYLLRFDGYQFLFWLNLFINFFFPFLAMMTRDAKRQMNSLKKIGMVLLFGRFLDIFLLVTPGILGNDWNIGILIAGIGWVMLQGGIWLTLIYKGLEGANLLPVKHPYLEESIHHDTGI